MIKCFWSATTTATLHNAQTEVLDDACCLTSSILSGIVHCNSNMNLSDVSRLGKNTKQAVLRNVHQSQL